MQVIYMVECGMSVGEIAEDLKPHITSQSKQNMRMLCSEYMRLVYPLYAIMNKKEIKFISYEANKFSISLERTNDIITNIVVSPAESWDSSIVEIYNLDVGETAKWCLSEFSTCINLAALWDKQQH